MKKYLFPALAVGLLISAAHAELKAGFLYNGPKNDAGYNEAQEIARLYVEKNLPDVKTMMAEKIPENADAERVMEKMIRSGATVIFATSYGYFDQAVRVGKKYPNVLFLHCGGEKLDKNLGTYFAYADEATYLAGVAAARVTKSGKIGYIAAAGIPQIMRSINALALGAQSVNPKITTTVIWTSSWNDVTKESAAVNAMADQGIDVVGVEVDSPIAVVQAAEKRGIYSIGQFGDASAFAPKGWLVGTLPYWGPMMVKTLQQIEAKTWKPERLLGDLASGDIRLTSMGPGVSPETRKQIEELRTKMASRSFSIWSGPILKQDGTPLIAKGATLPQATVDGTDFFVKGVIGTTK
jgi:basic membrane lipoprotein Med (substrate-binding protein (PBP1-ABC) superfamily)